MNKYKIKDELLDTYISDPMTTQTIHLRFLDEVMYKYIQPHYPNYFEIIEIVSKKKGK